MRFITQSFSSNFWLDTHETFSWSFENWTFGSVNIRLHCCLSCYICKYTLCVYIYYICMYVCMHAYTTHMHMCMHVCMSVYVLYMYVFFHTCIYVCECMSVCMLVLQNSAFPGNQLCAYIASMYSSLRVYKYPCISPPCVKIYD